MKVIQSVVGLFSLIFILASAGANLSSCKKETIKTVHDTLVVKDTLKVTDSVYNLNDGLVAYYNFNNGSLSDSSGYNNNIVFNNAVKTADRFGNVNNAYLFNGTSSYMQVKNNVSLNMGNITLAAIVKLNGFYPGKCHGNEILQKGTVDQSQGVYFLRISDRFTDCAITADTSKEELGGSLGDYGFTSTVFDSANYIRTNKWMNIVYTSDGKQSKIYIDGVLKRISNGNSVFNANGNDLFIGRAESTEYPYWFNGIIDEIRIYNRALSAASVKQLNSLKN